jgi:8-oxo-(d)GTP phosphatase
LDAGVTRVVRAAGGVVARDGEVVLVHRPRYDDWSLPKGKLSRGEHPLAAAVREVEEETGVLGVPLLRLPTTRYLTGAPDVEKSVEYWAMRARTVQLLEPNDEVDELRWLPVAEAAKLLTYAHDRGVLSAYAALPPVTGLVVLVRHALAGSREEWPAPDKQRPLDDQGLTTAHALARLLMLFEPAQVRSATPVRCVQTVEPLAKAIGTAVERDPRFDEDADPVVAAQAVRALAASGTTTVVCSQGGLVPPLLRVLTGRGANEYETDKGAGWALAFNGTAIAGVSHFEPPTVD